MKSLIVVFAIMMCATEAARADFTINASLCVTRYEINSTAQIVIQNGTHEVGATGWVAKNGVSLSGTNFTVQSHNRSSTLNLNHNNSVSVANSNNTSYVSCQRALGEAGSHKYVIDGSSYTKGPRCDNYTPVPQ